MEHRIGPEECWWLAPWYRKTTYEKFLIALGFVVGVLQTVQWYERGYAINWILVPMYWFSMGWAYFSRPKSSKLLTELELNRPLSVQAERDESGVI